jgi:transposase
MIPSLKKTQVEDSSETEGARSATGVTEEKPASGPQLTARVPNPEVSAKAQRRKFTAEYKLRIVQEAEQRKEQPGEIGALLRREGLYSSLLTAWRREVEQGARSALRSKKRGPKARVVDPRMKELERENARLRKRLEHAELIITVQKKVSKLLGIPLESPDDETN